MKHTIRWLLFTVLVSGVCSYITYRIAYRSAHLQGQVEMIRFQSWAAATTAGEVLRKTRSGNVPDATRLLEIYYFGSAENYFHRPIANANEVEARRLARDVAQYRDVYRTNRAEWDTVEQKLEKELASVK